MIYQPEIFVRALFIVNDNKEQFDAYVVGEASRFSAGNRNAAIRPLRKQMPLYVAGIPKGKRGRGYSELDATTKSKVG